MLVLKDFSEFAAKAACDARQLSTLKLNLARPMSYHDATTLTFLNKGRILSDQPLEFPQDIQWKRDLVNVMYDIFMAACPDQYVSHDYVKIMRELIMIYLNSVEPRAPVNAEVWQAIQQSLAECKANKRSPYKFTSAGLEVKFRNVLTDSNCWLSPEYSCFSILLSQILALILDEKPGVVDGRADIGGGGDVGSDEDVSDEAVVQRSAAAAVAASNAAEAAAEGGQNGEDASGDIMLKPQVELAEKVFGDLDTVVDTFWRVFSHAWARCLPTAPSKELWGPRFKQLFFKEFLQPLEERW